MAAARRRNRRRLQKRQNRYHQRNNPNPKRTRNLPRKKQPSGKHPNPRSKSPKKGPRSNAPLLDKSRVLEALASEPGATKRDLARKLSVKGSNRITLKRILKELDEEGVVTGNRKKGYTRPGELPEVTVLEITGQDMDGELLAQPQRWESNEEPPKIIVLPGRDAEAGP